MSRENNAFTLVPQVGNEEGFYHFAYFHPHDAVIEIVVSVVNGLVSKRLNGVHRKMNAFFKVRRFISEAYELFRNLFGYGVLKPHEFVVYVFVAYFQRVQSVMKVRVFAVDFNRRVDKIAY